MKPKFTNLLLIIFVILFSACADGESENESGGGGEGTVTDPKTGLMWIKTSPSIAYTWEDAIDYCKALDYDGYKDWYLPSVDELRSILTGDMGYGGEDSDGVCYWDETTFRGECGIYHTATETGSLAWPVMEVNFFNGSYSSYKKYAHNYVRCVRLDEAETSDIPVKLRGEWLNIDSGEEIQIISYNKYIFSYYEYLSRRTQLDYEILDDDLLKITDSHGNSKYLIRSGINNAHIRGKVNLLSSFSKPSKKLYRISDIGNIKIRM